MARLAGVDLPAKKRAEIGLTYIYGIGRTRAKSLCHRAGINPDTKIADLSEDDVNRVRQCASGAEAVRTTRKTWQKHPQKPARRNPSRRRKNATCPLVWCMCRRRSTTPSSPSRTPPG